MDFSALPNDVLIKILTDRRDIKKHEREIKETKQNHEQLIKVLNHIFNQYLQEDIDKGIVTDYIFHDNIENPFIEVLFEELYTLEKDFYDYPE
jgi:5-methylcytosine-specific restriction endonuclease McrBC regulatory subunit McrC